MNSATIRSGRHGQPAHALVRTRSGEAIVLCSVDGLLYELENGRLDATPDAVEVARAEAQVHVDGEVIEPDIDWAVVGPDLQAALLTYTRQLEELRAIGFDGADGIQLWGHLLELPGLEADHIVPGLLARGLVTLVQGREKLSGKSTLMASVAGHLARGEETVFGPAYRRAVRSVWLTEEPEYARVEKAARFGLGEAKHGVLIVSDALALPIDAQEGADLAGKWRSKLAALAGIAQRFRAEHVIIDTLSRCAAVEDEAGRELGARAEAASAMAQQHNLAVTLVHHNSKNPFAAVEDRGRGSTSLQAAVDQYVQVERPEKKLKKGPNVRRLTSFGRVQEADWIKWVELRGDAYVEETTGMGDALLLNRPMDVDQFAEVIDKSPAQARRRLEKVVEAKLATYDDSGGRRVWSPIVASEDET
jgi:AAA domain